MKSLLLLALIVAVSCLPPPDKWAVLVSGSRGYINYRHQANLCHSYHVLIDRGFNPNNIIVFSFDDVPYNINNPHSEKLFNRPDEPDHPAINYNKRCWKDYTKYQLNPTNFYNVLTGNAAAMIGIGTGKVLQSTQYDNVFIYFTGLGGYQYIKFPTAIMTANQFKGALQTMYKKQMYKKMVIYLESPRSGSMFNGILNPSWNILAVASSMPNQFPHPIFCPPNDVVSEKHIGSCLGTRFSVGWTEDADQLIVDETLYDQIHKLFGLGPFPVYGDVGFTLDTLGSFIGDSY